MRDESIVLIATELGELHVRLEPARAPKTVENFLRYVAVGDYDGGVFFRSVHSQRPGSRAPIDIVQARRRFDDAVPARFPPIQLETTAASGLWHQRGALSMARASAHSATYSFFLVTADATALDFGGERHPDGRGFAVFGITVSGWDVLDRIHAAPTEGERILAPIGIQRVCRLG